MVRGFKPNHACSSFLCLPGICTGLPLQNGKSIARAALLVQHLISFRPNCLRWDRHLRLSLCLLPLVLPLISSYRILRLSSRLRCVHIVVVLLLEQVALDLGVLQQLKVALYEPSVSNDLI